MEYTEKYAIEIAQLLKYKLTADEKYFILPKTDPNDYEKCVEYEDVVKLFSSYNILMPLIFDFNNSDFDGTIHISQDEVTLIHNDSDYRNYGYREVDYNNPNKVIPTTQAAFIKALQKTIIAYLELVTNKI